MQTDNMQFPAFYLLLGCLAFSLVHVNSESDYWNEIISRSDDEYRKLHDIQEEREQIPLAQYWENLLPQKGLELQNTVMSILMQLSALLKSS